MVRLISRQRGDLAALKLTKLFGIDDFPAAKDSGKVLIIIIYCYLIIIIIIIIVIVIIIYMKKLLDSDWLRAVQFKCNTSAKSVIQCKKCNTSANYTS